MVERLQDTQKGATFVDLDGTLVSANSMHVFMRRIFPTLMRRGAPGAALRSLWWMGLRTLRLTSHKRMKWHLTKDARKHFKDEDWERTAIRIYGFLNPRVRNFVESRKQRGCDIYIATAAPQEYVEPLCRMLGYDGVVATEFTDDRADYEEMRGLEKREGIHRLLEQEGLRLESFLTDHYDDFPTASEYPGLTILVNPDKKMAAYFRNARVTRYL